MYFKVLDILDISQTSAGLVYILVKLSLCHGEKALCHSSFKATARIKKEKWLRLSENLPKLQENWLEVILECKSALQGSQNKTVKTRNTHWEKDFTYSVYKYGHKHKQYISVYFTALFRARFKCCF